MKIRGDFGIGLVLDFFYLGLDYVHRSWKLTNGRYELFDKGGVGGW
jgi:hypothetical protein